MAKKESNVTRGKKTVSSTLGRCRYCGLYYEVKSGEQDPGNCGRAGCVQKAADINRIETTTTSGVTIVEFTGDGSKKQEPNKSKVGDNMYIMDVTKEHVYSVKEMEEMSNEERPKKSTTKKSTTKRKTTKKESGKTKKAVSSKKTNTKRVSKK